MIRRNSGAVCVVASALALTSYVGYAAYSPTKYALRGLADTLRNELASFAVNIHIAYPANMQTPGFEIEQQTKPKETKNIEASDTIYDPQDVARSILRSMALKEYNIYCGAMDVGLLGILSNGMTPRSNTAQDILLFPLAVLIGKFVQFSWEREVKRA